MSKEGVLSNESVERAKKAISLFEKYKLNFLITSGWNYRLDSELFLCEVVRQYIIENSKIDPKRIITLPKTRDTVGEAFFCLRQSQEIGIEKLYIVTSDYHKQRVKKIFKVFFTNTTKIEIICIKTGLINDSLVKKNELKSIKQFEETFASVDNKNIDSIYECLLKNHPFYNGKVYPKIYK